MYRVHLWISAENVCIGNHLPIYLCSPYLLFYLPSYQTSIHLLSIWLYIQMYISIIWKSTEMCIIYLSELSPSLLLPFYLTEECNCIAKLFMQICYLVFICCDQTFFLLCWYLKWHWNSLKRRQGQTHKKKIELLNIMIKTIWMKILQRFVGEW